ncbi:MAG: DUF177 domain-containing protein [Pseudomonadota bacterium]|nr:DUF177 domain-containing protein [Pseudomonadota bacterium]
MNQTPREFSRRISIDAIQRRSLTENIVATPEERAGLAARFGLQALEQLEATLYLRTIRGGSMVEVHAKLLADVVQTCGVTLAPLPRHVEEEFTALFAPARQVQDDSADDHDVTGELEDSPEPFEDGGIDLGELVAQHLALALDPYPRAEGVSLDPALSGQGETGGKSQKPLAALARLKTKQ